MGTIEKYIIKVHASKLSMQIGEFYNGFDLLENFENQAEPEPLIEPDIAGNPKLKSYIEKFNLNFREAIPQKKFFLRKNSKTRINFGNFKTNS